SKRQDRVSTADLGVFVCLAQQYCSHVFLRPAQRSFKTDVQFLCLFSDLSHSAVSFRGGPRKALSFGSSRLVQSLPGGLPRQLYGLDADLRIGNRGANLDAIGCFARYSLCTLDSFRGDAARGLAPNAVMGALVAVRRSQLCNVYPS